MGNALAIAGQIVPAVAMRRVRIASAGPYKAIHDLIKLLNSYRFPFDDFNGRLRHECCVTGKKNRLMEWILAVMRRIAIPIYKSRVSPVFDTCTRLLLIEFKDGREIARREFDLDNFSLRERVKILEKNAVAVIICGGISDVFHAILSNSNIPLICGICGNVDEVISAHIDGQLDDPCFFMPGYKAGDKE